MSKFICGTCGYVYDQLKGDISLGLPAVEFRQLDKDWACPICGVPKHKFERHNV